MKTIFNDHRDAYIAHLSQEVQELKSFVVKLQEQQDSFDKYVAIAQVLRFTVGFGFVPFTFNKIKDAIGRAK